MSEAERGGESGESRHLEHNALGVLLFKEKQGGWVGAWVEGRGGGRGAIAGEPHSAPQERWGALDRASESLGRASERHMA